MHYIGGKSTWPSSLFETLNLASAVLVARFGYSHLINHLLSCTIFWLVRIRVHYGYTQGFLYLWLGRVVPTDFLKILSPWPSKSIKNWLSNDLKMICATYLQNWCHRSLDMVKKSQNTRSIVTCGYLGFFSPYLDSCDINFEGRWPKSFLNHNSVNS